MSTLREAQPPAATVAATTSATPDRLLLLAELTLDLHFTDAGQTPTLSRLDQMLDVRSSTAFPPHNGDTRRQRAKFPWECSDSPGTRPIWAFPSRQCQNAPVVRSNVLR